MNKVKFLTGNKGLKNDFPKSCGSVVSGTMVEVGVGVRVGVMVYLGVNIGFQEYWVEGNGAEVGIALGALENQGVKNDCLSVEGSVGRGEGVGVGLGVGVGVGVPFGGLT